MLDLAILGLLKEQPLHGYELKKRLGETLGSLWGISYGSLYPALRRLERDGSIEIVEPERRRRCRCPPPARSTATSRPRGSAARPRRPAAPARPTASPSAATPASRSCSLDDDGTGDDERTFALKLAFCGHLDAEPRARAARAPPRRARRPPGARPALGHRPRRSLHALAVRAPHPVHPTRSRVGRGAHRRRRARPTSADRQPVTQGKGATAS